jgi:hypothetical protein
MGVYSGDDSTFATSADIPDDGDNPDAASVNVGLEAAIDGLAYLESRVLTWTVQSSAIGSKVPLAECLENTDSRWTRVATCAGGVGGLGWEQSDMGSIGTVWFEVFPPHAMARLSHVYVRLQGSAGHAAGVLPTNMPIVNTGTIEDGVITSGTPTTDPSPDVGVYEAAHTVDHAAIDNDPLAPGERLFVRVTGEYNGTAQAGLRIHDITCTWTSEDVY